MKIPTAASGGVSVSQSKTDHRWLETGGTIPLMRGVQSADLGSAMYPPIIDWWKTDIMGNNINNRIPSCYCLIAKGILHAQL